MLWTVFQDLPFDERLEKVAEAGYQAVELVHEFQPWSDSDFRRVHAKKRELRMTFDATAGIRHGIGDPAERDAFLAEVRAMLPVMERLECSRLIVLSGNRVPKLSPHDQHASCVEGLKQAAELTSPKNVELLLENIDPEENPNYYLTSVAEGFEIVRQVASPRVKFLYDFFHEQIAEGNLIEKLEKNINLVGLVHVADVPGRHQPGTGEIHYPNIFRKLAELRYDRYVAMEFKPTGDPVQCLQAARELVLNSVA
jgi:hydroxypyruvate isomerase